MTPYPDSEYPSILRGKDKRESQRLLAAAPDLLEALKDLMALYKQGQLVIEGEADEGDDPVVGAAFAAIAKAEGGVSDG